MKKPIKQQAWLVDVNMGYGHQRAAYPLRHIAFKGRIINANDYKNIPWRDRVIWRGARKFYESISAFKRVPLIGSLFFAIFDQFQKILSFYPERDLSKPNFYLKQLDSLFEGGWGKHLIEKMKKKSMPLVSTFFIPAFMAEFFTYLENIFCVVCDADIARSWASSDPFFSRIRYFAPTERVVERLMLYGVKKKNIFLTGFPLPLENIGSEDLEVLKHDLTKRLLTLDPKRNYFQSYRSLVEEYVGRLPKKPSRPLTLMFSVGGAGVRRKIGVTILRSLREKIKTGKIKVILSIGIKEKNKEFFLKNIKSLNLKKDLRNKDIEIVFDKKIDKYFEKFNIALRKTDILWTKPSELVFYTGLGLPIIIAPPVGSQEYFNQEWLLELGSGIEQKDPEHADEWLFDLLEDGWFAEAAMQGFVEAEKRGVFNIQKIMFPQRTDIQK